MSQRTRFSATPLGDSAWRIEMSRDLQNEDTASDMLRTVDIRGGWDSDSVDQLLEILDEAVERIEEAEFVRNQSSEEEVEEKTKYNVLCIGCGSKFVVELGPEDVVKAAAEPNVMEMPNATNSTK